MTLRFFRIRKGTFEEFHRLSDEGVWPCFEAMGARVIGQWRRVYPPVAALGRDAGAAAVESPDHDEAYMMVRYRSYEHWEATRPQVMAALLGNGPAFDACSTALERRARLTLASSVVFLEGVFHGSPPVYLPALDETYHPAP